MKSNSEYYLELFKEFGKTPQALGWTKGKQFLRYDQLTRDCNLFSCSILDVGSGFGDFVSYLKLREDWKTIQYLGVDSIGEFVDIAKKNHYEKNFDFKKIDFLNSNFNCRFDYVISSGIFNLKKNINNQYDEVKLFIEKMLSYCNKSVSIDFLSDQVDYVHKHSFHYNPSKILSLAYNFSKNVTFYNDYFPFEFTLRINKDDSFDKNTTIFNSLI